MSKQNIFFLSLILVVAGFLMFSNIGNRYMNGDEVHTAVVAKSIVKYGKPSIVDGEVIYGSGLGMAKYEDNAIIQSAELDLKQYPPLQFYFAAFGLLIFGLGSLGGRIIPAIFGILTLPLLYFTVLKMKMNKTKAMIAVVLLTLFVPFYLYSRQARYYSISMFFCLLVIYSYFKILNNEKHASLFFIVSNILSFYTYYISFGLVFLSILLHALITDKGKFKTVIKNGLITSLFTLPWFIIYNPFDTGILSLYNALYTQYSVGHFSYGSDLGSRIIVYLASFTSLILYFLFYVFPIVFIPFLFKIKRTPHKTLILIILILSPIIDVFMTLGITGLWHHVFTFPLYAILSAEVLYYISKKSKTIGSLLFVASVTTNLLMIAPFFPFKNLVADNLDKESDAYFFVRENIEFRSMMKDYIYELTHNYRSPIQLIVEKLNERGKKGDVFITNNEIANILFYTEMTNFRKNLNKSPDWIIPREPYYKWGDITVRDYMHSIINERYEKITINTVDYPYLYDDPHPRQHRFKQVSSPERRYDSYPIEIYHLKE